MRSQDPVPVEVLEKEVSTDERNGTLIEIEGIHLRGLDQGGIIHFIQRHLARMPKNMSVFVNNHECEFEEPPVASEKIFTPEATIREILGDVKLVLKISKKYLEDDFRGISIYSKGNWHETTLAGSEGREMAQYIFGEIDVPRLEDDKSPIPPFDVSRSGRLNDNNPTVQAIYGFVGEKVDEVRRELVNEEKKRKASEDAKRLADQADKIADIINDDFNAYRQQIAKARAKAAGGADAGSLGIGSGDHLDELIFGKDIPADIVSETGGLGHGEGTRGDGTDPPTNSPIVTPNDESQDHGVPAGGSGKARKQSGGFRVEFDNMGAESKRAKYASDERTIYVNLDHPQLVAAKGFASIDDPGFRRLAIEMAFSEYAIALASELDAKGNYIDPSDPIFDIRETLNRVARRGASLYSTDE